MPDFDASLTLTNQSMGKETCLVLDLNILNQVMTFQKTAAHERSPQLLADIDAIKQILYTPGLVITAGFAIGEADKKYVACLSKTYEDFLSVELPTYRDAPNSTPIGNDRSQTRKFKLLPDDDQLFFAIAHLALLKVHDISLSQKSLSPEAKFDLYLEYMDRAADMVPGIETEIAKHFFFQPASGDQDPFLMRSKKIRENFDKGGRGEKRVDRILNGARDIMLIRGTASKDGKTLDGKMQDMWLLTADMGVAALCNSVYFFPADGEHSKFTTTVDTPFRRRSSYWRYVDAISHDLLSSRMRDRRRRPEENMLMKLQHIRALAQEQNGRMG